jgi:hypothetical protein
VTRRAGTQGGTRLVAAVLLVAAAVVGLARLPGELHGQVTSAADQRAIPRVGGLAVQPPIGVAGTEFLAFVRRTVPAAEPVRVVQPVTPLSPLEDRDSGQPGVCGYSATRLTYYWLQYALLPHPMTCAGNARWTVYARVPPPDPLPAGAVAYRRPGGWTLVRR